MKYSTDDLLALRPCHETLVGIDSDGCVFDSMGIKQRECFHPEIIRMWGLEAIEPALRETAEFVNLFSRDRGSNRFIALLRVFELLPGHPGATTGADLPPTASLRRFVESGRPITNGTLQTMVEESGDPELQRILDWSLTINRVVEETVQGLSPFEGVREALDLMAARSDLIICSQTPEEALVREWEEHGIDRYVRLIAGQELGTKGQHLILTGRGKYAPGRGLMIGDAPGDLNAAREADMLFYPILPGDEVASWRRLINEGYPRFLAGSYAGEYEAAGIQAFDACLPEHPAWQTSP